MHQILKFVEQFEQALLRQNDVAENMRIDIEHSRLDVACARTTYL